MCEPRAFPHRTVREHFGLRRHPWSVARFAHCPTAEFKPCCTLFVVVSRGVRSLIVLVTFSLAGALGSGASRNVWAAADVRRTACSTAHPIQHTTRCEGLAQCRGYRSLTRIGRCAAQSILQQNLAVDIRAWLPSAKRMPRWRRRARQRVYSQVHEHPVHLRVFAHDTSED